MRVLTVNCNNCGAPLEAPRRASFITCQFCHAQLKVQRTSSTVSTEVLEDIAADVKHIRRQNEVDRLDREWMMSRRNYEVRSRNGHTSLPSTTGSMAGTAVAVVFGIFWMSFAASMGAPPFFVLFGVVFIGVAIFGGLNAMKKAQAYQRDYTNWRRRRRKLLEDHDDPHR